MILANFEAKSPKKELKTYSGVNNGTIFVSNMAKVFDLLSLFQIKILNKETAWS